MTDAELLEELLLRWNDLRLQNDVLSAEELCGARPDLVDQLRNRIAALASMERFLDLSIRGPIDEQDYANASGNRDTCTYEGPAQPWPPGSAVGPAAVPGFEIIEELGRGGMGIVFKARQLSTHRVVALKVLLQGRFASPRQRRRFEREVEIVAGLKHPDIVTVHESGSTPDGWQYCAMEHVDGRPLDEYFQEATNSSREELLELFARICEAVAFAHQHGVIHRDLKPGNILIDDNNQPRILDFGLAKLTEPESEERQNPSMTVAGEFLGTLAYASPEQVAADPALIDTRTDIYSLGVILYRLLTGQSPYPVTGAVADLCKAITECEPILPSALDAQASQRGARLRARGRASDQSLDAIVLKALAKDRDARYQSARTMADDLRNYLAGEPIQAQPPGLAMLLRSWFRRNVRTAVLAIVIGLTCGLLSALAAGATRLIGILNGRAAAYSYFPSLPRPLMAVNTTLPNWLVDSLTILGAIVFVGMGPLTVSLLRTKRMSDDLVAGLATGLIAGITAFAVSVGWGTVVAVAIEPAFVDLASVMGQGASQAENGDEIVRRFPDLLRFSAVERQQILARKLVGDIESRIPIAIGVGMGFAMVTYGGFGVFGSVLAGHLSRQPVWGVPAILLYLEPTIPFAWSVLLVYLEIFFVAGSWNTVAWFFLLAAAAGGGVLGGWSLYTRFRLYLGLFLIFGWTCIGLTPWPAVALAIALLLMTFASDWRAKMRSGP
jgi:serine/threonine protein kinase